MTFSSRAATEERLARHKQTLSDVVECRRCRVRLAGRQSELLTVLAHAHDHDRVLRVLRDLEVEITSVCGVHASAMDRLVSQVRLPARMVSGALGRAVSAEQHYYHGTTVPDLTHVTPGHPVTFASDSEPGYAYAASTPEDAWDYASKAHDWKVNRMTRGPFPVPRVYQVEPLDEVEQDPQGRGNNEGDVRSRHPFRVVREVPMPDDMGEPDDWRS